jgi:hypothetical protein
VALNVDKLFTMPINLKFQPGLSFTYLFCLDPFFIPCHALPFVALALDALAFELKIVVVIKIAFCLVLFLQHQVVGGFEFFFEWMMDVLKFIYS